LTPFAKLAWAAVAATYVLIAIGGLVRATDSGLGCPDWPLCFGDWLPPPDLHAWIEHTHRLVAAVFVGPLVGAVALMALVTRRDDPPMLVAAALAGVLVIVQSLLGRSVVLELLRAELVVVHLAMALAVLAATLVVADRAQRGSLRRRNSHPPLAWLAGITAAAVFLQMLLGSWVSGQGAGLAFADFPLMEGAVWPALQTADQAIHAIHRALGIAVLGLVLTTSWSVWRASTEPLPRRLAAALVLLTALQVGLGAANVWSRLSALFVVPHLAVGAAIWGVSVWLVLAVLRTQVAKAGPIAADAPRAHGRRPGDTVRAYVALTKPRIIELLLVTTVPTMVLAQRGIPSPWLMAAVVIGGALAAGGANAINQYVDRDIDDVMRRTRHRPLPSQRIAPRAALRFGVALSVTSIAWLWLAVNPLSALLAASAIGFYVFVYTLWLKRSTPHNIVIGGAAGCAPVLVAWAAVTGRVEIPALVLFAIVFYWTPPHFWALALRYRADYAAAAVPMLPVVRGEAETARRIVVYALLLVVVSLALVPAAGMGAVYLVAALVLGGVFVILALRLRRNADDGRAAIGLFRYSISYLTLLFAAVAADALLRGTLAATFPVFGD
jgi:protoheme IX farnesyltransferase